MTVRRDRDREGYLVQVELNGQRKRKQVEGAWEAKRVEREMRLALERDRSYLGLAEALRGYTATLRTRAKAATVRGATFHGGVLEEHLGHAFNAAELRQADLDTLVGKLRAGGWRDTSINGTLRVLRAALNHAEREGKLDRAPRVALLRETRKLPSILSAAQVEELVAKASPAAGLAILLAAHGGLRHQEILHLSWADVDLETGELRVTAKAGWTPKAHAERAVPLNARLRAALAAPGEGWVFPAPGGSGQRPLPGLFEPVREAFKAAGLWDPARKPGLHMLRRTFASRLLAAGADIETVRELGGWADITTVQRYLASNTDLKRRAVAALEG